MNTHKGGIFDESGRLTCVSQNLTRIPVVFSKMYYSTIKTLDLSHNSIVNLQGLEGFLGLNELILDDNCVSDAVYIPHLPDLHTFSLNKNRITNLEAFIEKVSTNLPFLRYLSLLGNPACPDQLSNQNHDDHDYKLYRYFVISHLPQLNFLDFSPVSMSEKEVAKRRGHLMRIAKPLEKVQLFSTSPCGNYLTPLPETQREIDDHQGAFGRCRYRYSGKNSEGNRFIQNSDL